MLEDLVERLQRVLADRDSPDFFARFERTVEQIASTDDPASVEALLTAVDDDLDPDLVYSVIHVVESFPDTAYLDRLLRALPGLLARSPQWAQTLLLRVLNSPPTLAELHTQAATLPSTRAAALRDTLRRLAAAEPEFAGRADSVLAALDS